MVATVLPSRPPGSRLDVLLFNRWGVEPAFGRAIRIADTVPARFGNHVIFSVLISLLSRR